MIKDSLVHHKLYQLEDLGDRRTVSRQTQCSPQLYRHTEEEHGERKALLVYLAALLAIGMADLFYNEPLYTLTLEWVPQWQSTYTKDSFMIQFLKAATILGEGYAAAAIILLSFVFTSRERTFFLLLALECASYVNKNLKLMYRNPRPYMVHQDIIAFGCSKSFGNPSGHSSLSACFYMTLFLVLFHDKGHIRRESVQQKHVMSDSVVPNDIEEPLLSDVRKAEEVVEKFTLLNWIVYAVSLIAVIATIGTVGFSRVALGQHSFN